MKEVQKKERSIFDWILLAVSVFLTVLLICALSIPLFSATTGTGTDAVTQSVYFFDIASSTTNTDLFGPAAIACLAFVGTLLPGLTRNRNFRWLGLGCGLFTAVIAFWIKSEMNAVELAGSSADLVIRTAGTDLLLTIGILEIIEFFVCLIAELFGKDLKIMAKKAFSKDAPVVKTAEERLASLNDLHSKGLIDDETYEAKKKEIVDEL